MKLGIFLPNWIGDAVMATPTLRALANYFGNSATCVGIGRPAIANTLAGTPWLADLILFDPRSKHREQRPLAVIGRLRAERLDQVVLLTNSWRTASLAWASGAPRRIGFARDLRRWFLTDTLQPPRQAGGYLPTSALDEYLRLAYALGCPAESPRLELATSDADEQAADRIWSDLRLPAGRQVIVLNSSGAFGAAKLWPSEYFGQLARWLAETRHLAVLVLCGPAERDIARAIVTTADHPNVVSLAEHKTSIGLSKACVRRARLLITTDSGPRHFAAAFGVPVVTLFGPTHQAWSATHYAGELALQHEVPCGPCQQRVCPLQHHQCMRDLTVETVQAAVDRWLHRFSHPQAA
jgi:heptosyltransferase-2